MTWETVIGLEVHVQLGTRSKMFCGCSTAFGEPPNTQVCPVCLGLPGALPSPNAMAIRLAARAALSLECTVHETSVFARKNYFYPDLPKGYQISQFDRPLSSNGRLAFESADRGPCEVRIERLHVEEDAGKLLHDRIAGRTAVDLNRAGVPLAEIVGGPDLRSPAEARAYLTALRQLMVYAEVSECSMEKGSLRVDANISLRRPGQAALGTKTEIKNLNSFANVERALETERARQQAVLDAGGMVEQVSLTFSAATGQTRPMRSKEESHDYRYFPDPDLPPLVLSPEWIDSLRRELPELPAARRRRFVTGYGLSAYDAGVLTSERTIADYFEAVVAEGAEPKGAANWVTGEAMSAYHDAGHFTVAPERLAGLMRLVGDGTLSHQAAKKVYVEMTTSGQEAAAVADRLGLVQVRDEAALGAWVDAVLAAHPTEVARYRAGETKMLGFLTGQVMKASRGKADPKGVQPVLVRKLGGL
ncbi:MAG TPA: Asp-tRNA(Asn)/Glu-tRNA(Gln) amidotransferase subunit GatB [Gemmatimonadales bacterium]|nr:Asp-tRNA(Asn)/Glu-tRNA(Gln) amidotransferase subunit GatB [Gemmatimonadales bacterium]